MDSIIDILVKLINPSYFLVFLFSIATYPKYKNQPVRYLPLMLFIELLFEYMASKMTINNTVLYNTLYIIYFPFYYYLVFSYLSSKNYKQCIKYFFLLFFIAAVVNPFFESFLKTSQFVTFTAGALLLIIGITLYFAEILEKNEVMEVRSELFFWVSIGLLLFYVGYLPIKSSYIFFIENEYFLKSYKFLKIIHLILTLIMNLFFVFGFVWARKK